MDPETAKAVAQIAADATRTAAAAGVGGALLGALVGIIGQLLLSSRTLKHQRILARDQSMRQWRSEHVVLPFLEAAYKRRSTFTDVLTVADQHHQAVAAEAKAVRLEQIQGHYTELLRDQKVTNIAYRSVEVQPFKSAVGDLSAADSECRQAVELFLTPTQINPENLKRLEDALAVFTAALVVSVKQCEQYIRDADKAT